MNNLEAIADKGFDFIDYVMANKISKCNFFIAGGLVPSVIKRQEVKDIDFYCNDVKVLSALVTSIGSMASLALYFDENSGTIKSYSEKVQKDLNSFFPFHYCKRERMSGKYLIHYVIVTDRAITIKLKDFTVQFITKYYGQPEEVLKTFDFDHCKNWVELRPGAYFNRYKINYMEGALEAITSNKLLLTSSDPLNYPVSAMARLLKFNKRGWQVPTPTLMKIFKEMNKLDLEKEEVVKEQMFGFYDISLYSVNAAYKDLQGKPFTIDLLMKLVEEL